MSSPSITATLSAIKNWFMSRGSYRTTGETNRKKQTDNFEKAALTACAHCKQLLNSCFRSQIDHSKEISLDIWSVSILIENKSGVFNKLFNHHVFLIIEGFSIEGKFWQKAHLMGTGIIQNVRLIQDCYSGCSNNGEVELSDKKHGYFDLTRCRPYRQTWTASKEKVEQMLQEIRWEQNHPEATPFRFLGEKSFVAVTTEFLDTRHPELLEIENQDQGKFKNLCFLLKNKEYVKNPYLWYLKSAPLVVKASNVFLIAWAAMTPFALLALANPGSRQIMLNLQPAVLEAAKGLAVAAASAISHILYNEKKIKMLKTGLEENENQLSFIETRAKTTVVVSQNCFNWARKKLLIIDVVVPENQLEDLIGIPELSLPKETGFANCPTDQ